MSVYIKGMEMPTRCGRCDFCVPVFDDGMFDHYECCITASIIDNLGEKMEDCHLIPVPPHEGLVDLNAPFDAQYYDEMTEEWLEKKVTVEDVLYGCMVDEMPPVIIPADPPKEETE